MTCIVGLVHDGSVYIGGDSAGVDSNYAMHARQDRKVFRNGDFIMGFTTSFRMGQLLAFGFNPPKPRVGTDIFAYMVTDFVDAARERMKAGGFATVREGVDTGGSFLVGYAGRLFAIHGDFQVAESTLGFDAVGCAYDVARGHLYGSMHQPPRARIMDALQAAEALSGGVRGPFHVETLAPVAPVTAAAPPAPISTMTVKIEADTADVDAKIERTTASAKRLQETADAALDTLSKLPPNAMEFGKVKRRPAAKIKRKSRR